MSVHGAAGREGRLGGSRRLRATGAVGRMARDDGSSKAAGRRAVRGAAPPRRRRVAMRVRALEATVSAKTRTRRRSIAANFQRGGSSSGTCGRRTARWSNKRTGARRRDAQLQRLRVHLRIVDGDVAPVLARYREHIQCRPGCGECCRQSFTVSEIEGALLREGLAAAEARRPAPAIVARARTPRARRGLPGARGRRDPPAVRLPAADLPQVRDPAAAP